MSFVFESMDSRGHEEVVFCHDKDTGLKAIIAVHNTTIGPAPVSYTHLTLPTKA